MVERPYAMAKLAQFALDFAIPPTRVLSGQTYDQCFQLSRNARPAYRWPVSKSPLAAHELPMPPQHGFRREQEQALAQPSTGVRGSLNKFASQHD
jgi:hypothetical protein